MSALRLLSLGVVLAAAGASAQSDGGVEARERCARRIAGALLGTGPDTTLLNAANPQSLVASILAPAAVLADGGVPTTPFQEKFSRYINATFNSVPGMVPAEDAPYALTKYVLQNGLPWKDLFVGPYKVNPGVDSTVPAVVVTDSTGLGYFRSRTWMVRYAGNETAGYRLVAAYRMVNNVLGVKLTAAQNTGGIDTATRASNPACQGCHFDPVFGLDLVAKVLSKRVGTGSSMTFSAPTDGPQVLLGGQTISNDAQLINAMVASTDFRFRACRLAAGFLYGRPEYQCEGAIFDRCMTSFAATGKITDAIAAIAQDPSFCQ
ncbi:MAG: hypothetical protein K1X89_06990 [Myxococcaceae bacterium]|nr:hypothetical protein [Myxococcaceae bacterium]